MASNKFNAKSSILTQNGTPEGTAWFFALISGLIIVLMLCAFARNITERILHFVATRFIKKNAFDWDDHLDNAGVLSILSLIVPIVIFRGLIPFAFDEHWIEGTAFYVEKAVGILLIIVIAVAINRLINAIRDYVLTLPAALETGA